MLRKVIIERELIQRGIVIAVGAALSYFIAERLGSSSPIVASIITIISLRISIQASITESFIQLLGITVGASTALLLSELISIQFLTILLAVGVSFIFARFFNLGDEGFINIAISALLISLPVDHERVAEDRISATIIGVFVSVVLSYWSHPKSPVERTVDEIVLFSKEAILILRGLAVNFNNSNIDIYKDLLSKSRSLNDKIVNSRSQAEEAIRYSKWSPTLSKEDARNVYNRYIAMEHIIFQIRNISRTIFEMKSEGSRVSSENSNNLINILLKSSDMLEDKNSNIRKSISFNFESEILEVYHNEITRGREKALEIKDNSLRYNMVDIYSSIMRIHDSFDYNNKAITEVKTPYLSQNPMRNFLKTFKKSKK